MKLKLVAALALSLAVFTGCASEEAPETTTPETTTAEGTVKKSEIAQDGETLVTEITFDEAGTPVAVQIDHIMDGGKSKYDEAKAGNYVMVQGADNTWDVQIDALETFLVENNFDLSKVTVNADGKTDAVTGVSIGVAPVLAGVEELLAE